MKRAGKPTRIRRRKQPAHTAAPGSIIPDGNVLVRVDPVPEAPAADRRRSERNSQSASGWLSNPHGAPLTSGRTVSICNLSLHGVGFTTHRPCHVGARHWILILQGAMRLSTRVRIVSVKQLGAAEQWMVGAEFF